MAQDQGIVQNYFASKRSYRGACGQVLDDLSPIVVDARARYSRSLRAYIVDLKANELFVPHGLDGELKALEVAHTKCEAPLPN